MLSERENHLLAIETPLGPDFQTVRFVLLQGRFSSLFQAQAEQTVRVADALSTNTMLPKIGREFSSNPAAGSEVKHVHVKAKRGMSHWRLIDICMVGTCPAIRAPKTLLPLGHDREVSPHAITGSALIYTPLQWGAIRSARGVNRFNGLAGGREAVHTAATAHVGICTSRECGANATPSQLSHSGILSSDVL